MTRAGAASAGPGQADGPSSARPAGRSGGRGAASKPLQAYVLHRYDWSESSLIVELFTRERGRMAVAAKGAKRPYSQLRGVLLPFQRLQVSLGRSADDPDAEVHTLRAAEWAGGVPMPGGGALFSAFYLNELLLRLLARQDPHAGLFDAYAQVLPLLTGADDTRTQSALRAFELTLLREAGLLPELGCVTLTLQPVRAEAAYVLHPEAGIAAARADEPALAGARWVALQSALEQGSLAALCAACGQSLPALRAGLRALLQYHLASTQLRTRRVMTDVRKLLAPNPSVT